MLKRSRLKLCFSTFLLVFIFTNGMATIKIPPETFIKYIDGELRSNSGPIIMSGGNYEDRISIVRQYMRHARPNYLFYLVISSKTTEQIRDDLLFIASLFEFRDALEARNIDDLLLAVYKCFKDWPTLYILIEADLKNEYVIKLIELMTYSKQNHGLITQAKEFIEGSLTLLNYNMYTKRRDYVVHLFFTLDPIYFNMSYLQPHILIGYSPYRTKTEGKRAASTMTVNDSESLADLENNLRNEINRFSIKLFEYITAKGKNENNGEEYVSSTQEPYKYEKTERPIKLNDKTSEKINSENVPKIVLDVKDEDGEIILKSAENNESYFTSTDKSDNFQLTTSVNIHETSTFITEKLTNDDSPENLNDHVKYKIEDHIITYFNFPFPMKNAWESNESKESVEVEEPKNNMATKTPFSFSDISESQKNMTDINSNINPKLELDLSDKNDSDKIVNDNIEILNGTAGIDTKSNLLQQPVISINKGNRFYPPFRMRFIDNNDRKKGFIEKEVTQTNNKIGNESFDNHKESRYHFDEAVQKIYENFNNSSLFNFSNTEIPFREDIDDYLLNKLRVLNTKNEDSLNSSLENAYTFSSNVPHLYVKFFSDDITKLKEILNTFKKNSKRNSYLIVDNGQRILKYKNPVLLKLYYKNLEHMESVKNNVIMDTFQLSKFDGYYQEENSPFFVKVYHGKPELQHNFNEQPPSSFEYNNNFFIRNRFKRKDIWRIWRTEKFQDPLRAYKLKGKNPFISYFFKEKNVTKNKDKILKNSAFDNNGDKERSTIMNTGTFLDITPENDNINTSEEMNRPNLTIENSRTQYEKCINRTGLCKVNDSTVDNDFYGIFSKWTNLTKNLWMESYKNNRNRLEQMYEEITSGNTANAGSVPVKRSQRNETLPSILFKDAISYADKLNLRKREVQTALNTNGDQKNYSKSETENKAINITLKSKCKTNCTKKDDFSNFLKTKYIVKKKRKSILPNLDRMQDKSNNTTTKCVQNCGHILKLSPVLTVLTHLNSKVNTTETSTRKLFRHSKLKNKNSYDTLNNEKRKIKQKNKSRTGTNNVNKKQKNKIKKNKEFLLKSTRRRKHKTTDSSKTRKFIKRKSKNDKNVWKSTLNSLSEKTYLDSSPKANARHIIRTKRDVSYLRSVNRLLTRRNNSNLYSHRQKPILTLNDIDDLFGRRNPAELMSEKKYDISTASSNLRKSSLPETQFNKKYSFTKDDITGNIKANYNGQTSGSLSSDRLISPLSAQDYTKHFTGMLHKRKDDAIENANDKVDQHSYKVDDLIDENANNVYKKEEQEERTEKSTKPKYSQNRTQKQEFIKDVLGNVSEHVMLNLKNKMQSEYPENKNDFVDSSYEIENRQRKEEITEQDIKNAIKNCLLREQNIKGEQKTFEVEVRGQKSRQHRTELQQAIKNKQHNFGRADFKKSWPQRDENQQDKNIINNYKNEDVLDKKLQHQYSGEEHSMKKKLRNFDFDKKSWTRKEHTTEPREQYTKTDQNIHESDENKNWDGKFSSEDQNIKSDQHSSETEEHNRKNWPHISEIKTQNLKNEPVTNFDSEELPKKWQHKTSIEDQQIKTEQENYKKELPIGVGKNWQQVEELKKEHVDTQNLDESDERHTKIKPKESQEKHGNDNAKENARKKWQNRNDLEKRTSAEILNYKDEENEYTTKTEPQEELKDNRDNEESDTSEQENNENEQYPPQQDDKQTARVHVQNKEYVQPEFSNEEQQQYQKNKDCLKRIDLCKHIDEVKTEQNTTVVKTKQKLDQQNDKKVIPHRKGINEVNKTRQQPIHNVTQVKESKPTNQRYESKFRGSLKNDEKHTIKIEPKYNEGDTYNGDKYKTNHKTDYHVTITQSTVRKKHRNHVPNGTKHKSGINGKMEPTFSTVPPNLNVKIAV